MQVDSFPVRIVARVERPTIDIELVGEDELELLACTQGLFRERRPGRVDVDEATVARDVRDLFLSQELKLIMAQKTQVTGVLYLTGRVSPSKIEGAQGAYWWASDGGYDGISNAVGVEEGQRPAVQWMPHDTRGFPRIIV